MKNTVKRKGMFLPTTSIIIMYLYARSKSFRVLILEDRKLPITSFVLLYDFIYVTSYQPEGRELPKQKRKYSLLKSLSTTVSHVQDIQIFILSLRLYLYTTNLQLLQAL